MRDEMLMKLLVGGFVREALADGVEAIRRELASEPASLQSRVWAAFSSAMDQSMTRSMVTAEPEVRERLLAEYPRLLSPLENVRRRLNDEEQR